VSNNDTTHFQYCQKIVVFRNHDSEVLLARRTGEADYDGVYTFIGGKMETTDEDIIAGLKREKTEEIGAAEQVRICPYVSLNVLFRKKDGNAMILPHYYATYLGGDIILGTDEYTDYAWVALDKLTGFEPKVPNIPEVVQWMQRLKGNLQTDDFVTI
jgi:NADH pyrophosphatase NudC (nudix superfamily)